MKKIGNPFKKYYYVTESGISTLYKINDIYLSDAFQFFVVEKTDKIYEDKKEALYKHLIIKLLNGVPLSNYKSSKYYKYYYSRLKNDYPEFLI